MIKTKEWIYLHSLGVCSRVWGLEWSTSRKWSILNNNFINNQSFSNFIYKPSFIWKLCFSHKSHPTQLRFVFKYVFGVKKYLIFTLVKLRAMLQWFPKYFRLLCLLYIITHNWKLTTENSLVTEIWMLFLSFRNTYSLLKIY